MSSTHDRIDPVNETIVTVPDAARHFRVSVPTAWRLVLTGKVASFKIGNARRTSLQAFARYIAAHNAPADD